MNTRNLYRFMIAVMLILALIMLYEGEWVSAGVLLTPVLPMVQELTNQEDESE